MQSLKVQAMTLITWTLVHMIAIHHSATNQRAWLNIVQIETPYYMYGGYFRIVKQRNCNMLKLEESKNLKW